MIERDASFSLSLERKSRAHRYTSLGLAALFVVPSIVPVSAEDQPRPGAHTRTLMQSDAPVNLIYLPSKYPVTRPEMLKAAEGEPESTVVIRDRFIDAFRQATYGGYIPPAVVVTMGDRLEVECASRPAADEIHKAAAEYKIEGSLNLIFVDAPACASDPTAGYASPDKDIVVNNSNAFIAEQLFVHEAAHAGGTGHAVTFVCSNATRKNCKVNQKDDDPSNSIMNHRPDPSQGYLHYSATDLLQLGLMPTQRVVRDLREGIYTLSLPKVRTDISILQLGGVNIAIEPSTDPECWTAMLPMNLQPIVPIPTDNTSKCLSKTSIAVEKAAKDGRYISTHFLTVPGSNLERPAAMVKGQVIYRSSLGTVYYEAAKNDGRILVRVTKR